MVRKRTGNNQFLKKFNQAVILDLIRREKGISKAELAEITGLSPTAVGVITASLLEEGYIHETGTGESKGGRRPVLLELKPRSFYAIGVDMDVAYMNMMLIDITGEVICERTMHLSESTAFEKAVGRLEDAILDMLDEKVIDLGRLLGIGISVPGLVNSETGEVVLAPNLQWENIDVKFHLIRLKHVPVYVENEAMASAICENWIGLCQDVGNFVCINIKSGIGAGIFTNGKLYRGAGGSAGEVGHIVVDENGPKCGCGNYGCLETLASTTRIADKAKRLVRQGIVSSLNEIKDVDAITIDRIVEAARGGDEAAKNILMESARYIGIAISSIINTLNPSKIVLGKEFIKYADLVMEHIKGVAVCKSLAFPTANVEITASNIGEKASALGAAIIPLKVLFGK